MKPIGPLMREHRLIERVVALMNKKLNEMREKSNVDSSFIEEAVDFFRTYADRTHHGKEEDILFRDMAKKKISPAHKNLIDELVEDHVLARKTVGALSEANGNYIQGRTDSLNDIVRYVKELVALYPKHIEKEDKHFFYPAMEYFSKKEQDGMLQEFLEFDKNMIHEKYQKVVEGLESI